MLDPVSHRTEHDDTLRGGQSVGVLSQHHTPEPHQPMGSRGRIRRFLGQWGSLSLAMMVMASVVGAQSIRLPAPPDVGPSLDTSDLVTNPQAQQIWVVPMQGDPVELPSLPDPVPPLQDGPSDVLTIGVGVGREIVIEKAAEMVVEREPDPGFTERTIPVVLRERKSGKTIRITPGEGLEILEPRTVARAESRPTAPMAPTFSGDPTQSERLLYPLPTASPVTSGFGVRIHPISGTSEFHLGVDLGAPQGTPVLAAYSGEVMVAGPNGGYGNLVTLGHGVATRTRYGHLSSISVAVGQYVERGSVIGHVGSTGNSTGPHLHFELWQQTPQGDWLALDSLPQLKIALAQVP